VRGRSITPAAGPIWSRFSSSKQARILTAPMSMERIPIQMQFIPKDDAVLYRISGLGDVSVVDMENVWRTLFQPYEAIVNTVEGMNTIQKEGASTNCGMVPLCAIPHAIHVVATNI
tara:strand:+ start:110 stop:457 length:348 start_codon:yes stop_codon:yes gene_type:complete